MQTERTTSVYNKIVTPNRQSKHIDTVKSRMLIALNGIGTAKYQRWSRGHKARGQGQGPKKNPRPRPRTAFPRTDTLEAKYRNARGQGQGPRTQAQVLSKKKKKKVCTKIFQAISTKKTFFKKFFKRSTKF